MSKKKDAGNPRYAFDSIQFSSLSKPSIPPQPPIALGFTSKMNVLEKLGLLLCHYLDSVITLRLGLNMHC